MEFILSLYKLINQPFKLAIFWFYVLYLYIWFIQNDKSELVFELGEVPEMNPLNIWF